MFRKLPRKTSEKQKQLIKGLYEQGDISVREIAKRANVSYSTAYTRTRALEIGFSSPASYKRQTIENQGHARWIDYHRHLARNKGAKSMKERKEQIAKNYGFSSFESYQEHLAKLNGYNSTSERRKAVIERKKRKPENRAIRNLIKDRLEYLGETQSWLALQIDTSKAHISNYARGINLPQQDRLERIFSALQVPYRTIDDLMQDRNPREAI